MTPGQFARKILGSRFETAGKLYRRVFVDMDKVVDVFARALPTGARCLDIGGGDGLVADLVLRRRPDVRITLVDIAPSVGGFVGADLAGRIELRPSTKLSDLIGAGERWDAVMMADVVHHIPPAARVAVFDELARLCRSAGCRLVMMKDIVPGSPRAVLSLWADHYITGDRGVVQVAPEDLEHLLAEAFGRESIDAFELSLPDPPNYCLLMRLRPDAGTRPPPVSSP